MAVVTYYFDGHTSIVDANSVWTNDANAFDGSTATSATTTSGGASDIRNLIGTGTTAPTSGGTIVSVRARLFANADSVGPDILNAKILNGVELLGTTVGVSVITAAFGNYVALTAPAAGWSWTILNGLNTDIKRQSANGGSATGAYRVEFEVTTISARIPNGNQVSMNGGAGIRPHAFSPGIAR